MLTIDAHWIRAQLDNGNGTRTDLAAAMGVGRDVVSKILTGRRAIKAAEIPVIARYFGLGEGEPLSDLAVPRDRARESEPDHSDSWRLLMSRLSQLTDAELDFLTVAAEGLAARRKQSEGEA